MMTQETIDKQIRISQEEIALAEKCIADLMQRKQELQQLIDSLNSVEVEPGRVEHGQIYHYLDTAGRIDFAKELFDEIDDDLHGCGNYYLTKEDAIRAEKQIRLFRLLDRFSRQNGWTDEAWEDSEVDKCYVYCGAESIEIGFTCEYREIAQVYFISESVAQQAIEKYHDLIMEVMAI